MGFLDHAGLTYFWGKVKAALAGKADAALVLDKATYDPTGKARDVFAYADAAAEAKGVFFLTGTTTDGVNVTMDQTWEEFVAAYDAGKYCVAVITSTSGDGNSVGNILLPLGVYSTGQAAMFVSSPAPSSVRLTFTADGVGVVAVDIATCPKTATVTLTAAGWANNSQSVTEPGEWPSRNITTVSPDPASHDAYGAAGVRCTAQNGGTFTFVCTKTPTVDLTVNIVCQEV